MAIVVQGIQAQNAADLVTAVNTYLATLVNPIIRGIYVFAVEEDRTIGRTYRAMITTEAGGAVIATPWTLSIFEAQNAVAAATAAAAYVVAAGAAFISAVRLTAWETDGSSTARCAAYLLANATGGASANMLPT